MKLKRYFNRLLVTILILTIVTQSTSFTSNASFVKFEKAIIIRYAYAKNNIIIYSKPSTKSKMISTYIKNDKIIIKSLTKNKKWYKVKYKGKIRYIERKSSEKYMTLKKDKKYWHGKPLNKRMGVCYGPAGGAETYYNLYMGNVVRLMRSRGFSAKKYPYWIRDDGVKMLGKYVIVAANLKVHPRGTTVKTSLGTGLVCDTGGFASYNAYGLDIATDW